MRLIFGTVAVALAASFVPAHAAGPVSLDPNDVIAARQAGFDLQQGIMAAMKAAVEDKQPVKPLAAGAKALAAWGAVIPSQFPAGTETDHETKAKPEIWSDPAGFAKAAQNFHQAAEKLAVLADADDRDAFAAQFAETGKACGACHRGFRVRKE